VKVVDQDDIRGLVMEVAEIDKYEFLNDRHALHPHPERVRDRQFQSENFLDTGDLVQVRYEMLRRHLVEKQSVTEVTQAFGISRQLFYMLLRMFRSQGIYGLLPRKRGPMGPCCRKPSIHVSEVSPRKRIHIQSISKHFVNGENKPGIRIHSPTRGQKHIRHKKGTRHN
jgi:hypothetical protein